MGTSSVSVYFAAVVGYSDKNTKFTPGVCLSAVGEEVAEHSPGTAF